MIVINFDRILFDKRFVVFFFFYFEALKWRDKKKNIKNCLLDLSLDIAGLI